MFFSQINWIFLLKKNISNLWFFCWKFCSQKNDLILLDRTRQLFRHIELPNPSIISDLRHKARMVQQFQNNRRSSRRSTVLLEDLIYQGSTYLWIPLFHCVFYSKFSVLGKFFIICIILALGITLKNMISTYYLRLLGEQKVVIWIHDYIRKP